MKPKHNPSFAHTKPHNAFLTHIYKVTHKQSETKGNNFGGSCNEIAGQS
jgi:hypothetical protein